MADIETPTWRDKNKAGNLMTRLYKHGNGEIEMTDSQIKAATAFLKKTVPDLSAMTLSGDKEAPIVHTVKWGE
jgi:hypothetical protein